MIQLNMIFCVVVSYYRLVPCPTSKWPIGHAKIKTQSIMYSWNLSCYTNQAIACYFTDVPFNHLSSHEGSFHITKGLEKAGISAFVSSEARLPPEDLFNDLEVKYRPP